jgi:membrane protease YdiL (CAAX protease family)
MVLLLAWLAPAGASAWLFERGLLDGLQAYLLFQAGMLGLVCLGALAVSGRRGAVRDLGLHTAQLRYLGWAGLALALYLPVDLLVQAWPLWSSGAGAGLADALRLSVVRESPAPPTPGLVLAMAVMAPLAEELGFRGLLQGSLARVTRGPWVAITGSAALWTLAHLDAPSASGWATTLVLGVILGLLRTRSGSVLPGMALHAAVNGAWLGVVGWAGAG